jgi:hypothetical protein
MKGGQDALAMSRFVSVRYFHLPVDPIDDCIVNDPLFGHFHLIFRLSADQPSVGARA